VDCYSRVDSRFASLRILQLVSRQVDDVFNNNIIVDSFLFFFALPFDLYSQDHEHELELIQTQMTQKPVLRAEVGMRVRCANKASAE